jgi:hypothetical protein
VVNLSEKRASLYGLEEGCHFVHSNRRGTEGIDPEAIAALGHAWYRSHDRRTTAAVVRELVT